MNRIVGLVLILLGGGLLYTGHRRAESLVGRTRSALTGIENSVDGKMRVSRQYGFYAAGVVLIGAGLVLAVRKPH